jgi:hypothetical protein
MIKGSDRYAIFVVGLLFAVGIFYLALHQGISAFKALDGDRIANAMKKGAPEESEDLRKLAVSRADALVWGANPAYAGDLAVAYQVLSRQVSAGTRKSVRTAAHDASEAELRAGPLNAYAWWRLGVLRAALDGGTTARSASYQWRSVRVQPNAMTLMPARLSAISDNWFRFEVAQRREVRPQFAAAWERDSKAVLRLAKNSRRRAVIRGALAIYPAISGAFEEALAIKR